MMTDLSPEAGQNHEKIRLQQGAEEPRETFEGLTELGAGLVSAQIEKLRTVDVSLLKRAELGGELAVVECHQDFKIEAEAARIDVHRTEQRVAAVDGDALGVQESVAERCDLDAGLEQLALERAAGVADHHRI